MLSFIRALVAVFVTLESVLSCFAGGVSLRSVDMPEVETGEYTSYVDPFIGTGGIPWTCGMLSPAATTPFGLVRLGADTCFVGGAYIFKTNTSGYYYEHGHIKGFSHSRLSGTGAEDYSMLRVTPAVGDNEPGVMPYSHKNETACAGYYAVYLPSVACLAEMTASVHTGVHRYTFLDDEEARLYIDVTSATGTRTATDAVAEYDEEAGLITGYCLLPGQFAGRYKGLPTYFAASVDREIKSLTVTGDESDLGIDISFGSIEGESVELRLAVSFVSKENAILNLKTETDGKSFEDVRQEAVSLWEERLSAVDIQADDETKEIFYTALYHSMTMPSNFTDVNGEYLGFDKQVHVAEGYTYRSDMSLWDTVRTTHPLYTLIAADVQQDCLKSLVEMTKQGGYNAVPRWPQGAGYTNSMFGDSANIMITESYIKGFTDFDVETLYNAMKNTSDNRVGKDGRDCVEVYNEYGYIPQDLAGNEESVSHTLEYSWQDAALAKLASLLGKTEDAEKYGEKAMYYKNLFNPETKYFQARNSDGSFVSNFNPNITYFYDMVLIQKYADCYSEGGAKHWRWSALQDIDGMIELFGSEEYFVDELDDFMKSASGSRASADPGAGYWVGNEHDMHTLYLFANAGRSDLTQKWVRWTLEERFSTDVNGLDGNDDGGALSAWYVFSSLGFYPLAGTDQYWLGSPCVDSATVTLSNGNTLKITANNQSDENVYVKSITLNEVKLDGVYVTHEQLMSGGELVFEMTDTPQ